MLVGRSGARLCQQRHFVPKCRTKNVDSISPQTGADGKSYRPPSQRCRKVLQTVGSRWPNCQQASPVFSSCAPAAAGGVPAWRRTGNNTVSVRPGERLCRTPGRTVFPGQALRRSAPPPARDQGAAPPRGNSGNKRLSSISPAYSKDRPSADSQRFCRSWRTILSQGIGSPPFPAGSIHGSNAHLPYSRSR